MIRTPLKKIGKRAKAQAAARRGYLIMRKEQQ